MNFKKKKKRAFGKKSKNSLKIISLECFFSQPSFHLSSRSLKSMMKFTLFLLGLNLLLYFPYWSSMALLEFGRTLMQKKL